MREQGIEPRSSGLESLMLPLHHSPTYLTRSQLCFDRDWPADLLYRIVRVLGKLLPTLLPVIRWTYLI